MTQKDKELLLKDLCVRLPFKVKISVNDKIESLQGINILDNVVEYGSFLSCNIEEVKPYLRPMSSMTDEEKLEYRKTQWVYQADYCATEYFDDIDSYDWLNKDWLNKNHFDYRGLIEKGLAIDATGLNIY